MATLEDRNLNEYCYFIIDLLQAKIFVTRVSTRLPRCALEYGLTLPANAQSMRVGSHQNPYSSEDVLAVLACRTQQRVKLRKPQKSRMQRMLTPILQYLYACLSWT